MDERTDLCLIQVCQRLCLLRFQRRQIGGGNVLPDLLLVSRAWNHAANGFMIENPSQGKIRHRHALRNQSANLVDGIQRSVEIHA